MSRTTHISLLAVLLSAVANGEDMYLQEVLIDGDGWQEVSASHQHTDGAAVDPAGNVFFADVPANRIYRIDTGKHDAGAGGDGVNVGLFAEGTHQTTGLMFGADGLLYGCQTGKKRIVTFDQEAHVSTVAVDVNAKDLVVLSDGRIYFTDPPNGQVWTISPRGERRVVAKDIHPDGLTAWPGEGTLVVTERSEAFLWTFRIETDGSLQFKAPYYGPVYVPLGKSTPGSHGMTVDTVGRIYVTTHAGIQMFETIGGPAGVMARPEGKRVSDIVFGGPQFAFLYATCGDKVYRRKTKATGAPYFLCKRP